MKNRTMKNRTTWNRAGVMTLSGLCSALFIAGAFAAETPDPWDRQVYFGEQHLHTAASPDAFAVGTRGTWADAYDWALGKEVTLSTTGEKMKKSTPYDFVAITDHAEYFGVMPRLVDPKDPLAKSEFAKKLQNPGKGAMTDPHSAISTILPVSYTHLRAHET